MASHGQSRSILKTYLGDPLSVLIIDRLSLSPVQFGLIALGTALVVNAISFALVGDQVIALSGWTETWAYAVYMYVIFPAIVGAYFWPFDTVTLRRFAVTVAAPLMPIIIELAISIGNSALRSR